MSLYDRRLAVCGVLCAAIIFLCSTAFAAEAAGLPADGRLTGVFSALVLVIFVSYSFQSCLRQSLSEREELIVPILILMGVMLVKCAALPLLPGLGIDVGSYQAWGARVADLGPARTYQPGYFLDYPPGYLYALWLASSVSHLIGAGGVAQRMLIEMPAVIADGLLALLVFAFVKRSGKIAAAYTAMLLVALNPALLFDTLVWGQSDSVPCLLMLLATILILDEEFELGWGVSALAALVKPQALMLLPVLGLWTLMKAPARRGPTAALAALAVGVVTVAPFQIGHPWNWLFSLYSSTAGYYHETSVNAFNLMALVGGLRQQDSVTTFGVSFFAIGMMMLAALYVFLGRLLRRRPSRETLLLTAFLALFGSFLVAPRMHERYLYPALVFIVPIAIEFAALWDGLLFAILAALSVTFLFNLAYVKYALEANIFFERYDLWAVLAAVINVIAMVAAIPIALVISDPARESGSAAAGEWPLLERLRVAMEPREVPRDSLIAIPWTRIDTYAVSALTAVAAFTRFFRLWFPPEIVFDEVHFVGQARQYLRAESFLDPHPPVAKLLIAASIAVFGDHSWSWRVPNALLGIVLVVITYLLARRLFASRLAAAFAGLFVICDGMFLIDSRIGVIDIVYLTFAAWSYLLLFRFAETDNVASRRRTLAVMGIALGLCLASKLYIPAMTFLFVVGFLLYFLLAPTQGARHAERRRSRPPLGADLRMVGALALVGGVAAIVYVGAFLPHYFLGWWGGIADLFNYYSQVIWYENSVASATHPYSAPWWSWPLLLRPIAYWQNFPKSGDIVATIWGGGNPVLWWGALTGISMAAVRALERRGIVYSFLVIGYLSYLLVWVPIGRTLFLYHYMPSVYLGFLALATVLADSWNGKSEFYEHAGLVLTLSPVFILGLGPALGLLALAALIGGYFALIGRGNYPGKLVCAVFVTTAVVVFIYFFPIWLGLLIPRAGYYQRMWLQGPGLRNWI